MYSNIDLYTNQVLEQRSISLPCKEIQEQRPKPKYRPSLTISIIIVEKSRKQYKKKLVQNKMWSTDENFKLFKED